MNDYVYFVGLMICATIFFYVGAKKWFSNSYPTKMYFVYLIGLITLLIGLFSNGVSAYTFCNESGYSYCVMNDYNNLSTRLSFNLVDEKGESYQDFAMTGYAIKGFYAIINYDGNYLYYNQNLSNWDDECPNNNLPFCEGLMIKNNGSNNEFIKIASIGDEYVGCPSLTSIKCDEKYCVWAGTGYTKPDNNTCSHIRVVECKEDNDCPENHICNKNNLYDWRSWKCEKISIIDNPVIDEPTNKDDYSTYDEPSSGTGYVAKYTASDASPVLFDVIAKIIHAIGSIFG